MAGESKLQTKIIKHLEGLGWEVNKRIIMSHNGYPDLECFKAPGMFMEIEVKDLGKKPDPIQNYIIKSHVNKGFKCFYADSFEMFLEKYNRF